MSEQNETVLCPKDGCKFVGDTKDRFVKHVVEEHKHEDIVEDVEASVEEVSTK